MMNTKRVLLCVVAFLSAFSYEKIITTLPDSDVLNSQLSLHDQFIRFLQSSESDVPANLDENFQNGTQTEPESDTIEMSLDTNSVDNESQISQDSSKNSQLAHLHIHKLDGKSYIGSWELNQEFMSTHIHDKFKSTNGKARVLYKIEMQDNKTHRLIIVIDLYDGQHRDRTLKLGTRFYPHNATLSGDNTIHFKAENANSVVNYESNYVSSALKNCKLNLTAHSLDNGLMKIKIDDANSCGINGFEITTEMVKPDITGKTINFVAINC